MLSSASAGGGPWPHSGLPGSGSGSVWSGSVGSGSGPPWPSQTTPLMENRAGAALSPLPTKPKTSRVWPEAMVPFQPTSEPLKAEPLWLQSTFQALWTEVPLGNDQLMSQPLIGSPAVIEMLAWKPPPQLLMTL